jgi:heptosyltransferase-2
VTNEAERSRRVVVRPPNWLGDAVLALPALTALRAHFADAHLTIAAAPAVAALCREETGVVFDDVIELPGRTRAAIAALRDRRFDVGVLLPNSFRSAWQMWRAGIAERWGYATSARRALLTKRCRPDRQWRRRHQSDYYRQLVIGLGVPCGDDGPRLAPTVASRQTADMLLGDLAGARLVGIAPGAAYGEAKQWPPDRMAALVRRLLEADAAAVVLVGAAHDREASRAIESWLRTHAPHVARRVIDLTGRTSVGALIGLIARMAVFVSNDSGAMHVAAAVGRPVVALFGPTDERRTGPIGAHTILTAPAFCRPCMLRDCPIDHRCMKRITVDAVHAAVTARLGI